jgi:hypothetical protein
MLSCVMIIIQQSSSIGLVVVSEEDQEPLLIHRVSPQIDMYSRQEEETIISWVDNELNTDIALSFQEGCGCNFIWEQIKSVQRQYLQQSGGGALTATCKTSPRLWSTEAFLRKCISRLTRTNGKSLAVNKERRTWECAKWKLNSQRRILQTYQSLLSSSLKRRYLRGRVSQR